MDITVIFQLNLFHSSGFLQLNIALSEYNLDALRALELLIPLGFHVGASAPETPHLESI